MPDLAVRPPDASSGDATSAPVRVRSPFSDESDSSPMVPIQPRFATPDPLVVGGGTTTSPEIDAIAPQIDTSKPGSPQNVDVALGSAGIIIVTWDAVDGADGYQIQTQAGAEIKTVVGQGTTAAALKLNAGTYGLTAFNEGGESAPTEFVVS